MRSMRRFRLAVLVLAACGGGASLKEAQEPQDQPARQEAGKRARDVIVEAYTSVRRGDVDGLQALATENVFVVGPAAGAVFISRSDTVVAMAGALGHGEKHKLTSRALQVTASPAARSA